MSVLEVINKVSDDKHTYSLMKSDTKMYVHINNHVNNENAVIVPLSKLSELLTHIEELQK